MRKLALCRWATSLAVPLLLPIGYAGDAQTQPLQQFEVSVDVNLVVLHATVWNKKGHFAPALREQDFEVYEDGVQQSIRLFRHEDIPVTVGLVVDHSGSMQRKLTEVIAAARTFAMSSNQLDQVFVVNFSEKVTLGLPHPIRFTSRLNELESAIRNAPAIGQTALYDAVLEAQERLQTGSCDKKVLIVISDGGDNASAHSLADVLKRASLSSALVYTIGIFDEEDADRNPDVLRHLARATGGEAFFPAELGDVVSICERIAREIRNQYTIGYLSGGEAQPGTYRSIRVVARPTGGGKLSVRARAGYTSRGKSRPIRDESPR